MVKVEGISAAAPAGDRSGAKLAQLAGALELLNKRIAQASQDRPTAVAIRERFTPSLADIQSTRAVIASQIGRGRHAPELLARVHAALADMVAILTTPLPAAEVIPLTRPEARRAKHKADRLDASTRELLGNLGKALAVGAAAASLYSVPAAAGCSVSGDDATCDGTFPTPVIYTYPGFPESIDDLLVHALTADLTPTAGNPAIVHAANGGDGGDGGAWSDGDGGSGSGAIRTNVNDADNKIVTSNIPAILTGSQGGDGGDGGGAGAGGSGGDGGQGGGGGSVTANIDIDIQVSGTNGIGLVALSAGGAGGDGGDFAVGVGSAGDGGQGGGGGSVTVNFGASSIITTGTSGAGIFASSTGGSGGDAGSCDVAFCGSSGGGNSATGGVVNVTTAAGSSIATSGYYAKGVYATSIGGFAGDGGSSYFAAGFASDGGSAGDGGSVTVGNSGSIITQGDNADAIYAQSIGGGGGDGGDTGISIASLGGSGSQGGDGGNVSATNFLGGFLETVGDFARGLFVQSVGGSGGTGGTASSLVSVGGNGSGASDGGTAGAVNRGTIVTHGEGSQAIYVQSIGGGGGDGGGAGGIASVGGKGGGGGDGKAVTATNSGSLTTSGVDATAIYAQSVGGGGGNGGGTGGMISVGGEGGAGGDAGTVTVTTGGAVHTLGDRANGVFAQSVGGGGGTGGGAASAGAFVNVSVGATGGDGGDSASVTVTADGASNIHTEGERAAAIFAQSVGGGGGAGGYGAGASAGAFGSVSVGVGGKGGEGGDGDLVTVTAGGFIETEGADSQGVFAQSVGGGGGTGGFAVAAALSGGPAAVSGAVAVGGGGGKGGDGALVTVGNTADITTSGDRSTAVFAQSVGGGGGAGGWSGAIAGSGGIVSGSISVSVGGFGDFGGDGGVVDVTNSGDLTTAGHDAYGILAQSVGGGGGTGGFSVSAAASGGKIAGALGLGMGGYGAGGGDGEEVTVTSTGGVIDTTGDRGVGILAQSIGGGGGAGGWSGALGAAGGLTSAAAAVSLGGSGGLGGDGAGVTVTSASNINTDGDDAHGIVAQSLGGGGGLGGYSVGAGVGAGATTGVGIAATFGGDGGGGGDASFVDLTSTGNIHTTGDRSMGVNAQSVGGGGGSGGFSGAIGVGAAGTTGIGVSIGMGGFGGIAGDGGNIFAESKGFVTTEGHDSQGVFAQSVGGGGGNGGFAGTIAVGASGTTAVGVGLTLGGFGGAGGDAGIVILSSSKRVYTKGDRSHGVQGQSIGGGGGAGGFAASLSAAASGTTTLGINLALGGFGAGGGSAGDVFVTSTGGVETDGADAYGVFAQSIGGGGGSGGFTANGSVAGGGSTSVGVTVGVGGFGGLASDGGDVTLTTAGDIVTWGDGSKGAYAQSVGGGGGAGGWSGNFSVGAGTTAAGVTVGGGGLGAGGGDGGVVTLTSTSRVYTDGNDAQGLLAQSVGGGGGAGGFAGTLAIGAGTNAGSGSLTVGGLGGPGGDADLVTLTSRAVVMTMGDRSHGAQAQSIGGGGGNGGFAASFSGAFSSGTPASVGLRLGGLGGIAGDGGVVSLTSTAGSSTYGDEAHAVFAQSVGGGGGNGGFTAGGSLSAGGSNNVAINAGVGGFGGGAGDGDDVTIDADGLTTTSGDGSHAIFAQSVGGGGGSGGWSGSLSVAPSSTRSVAVGVNLGGFGGSGGGAGDVTVTSEGQVMTEGEDSHGIFAQSVGGGGGVGGMAVSANFGTTHATNIAVSMGGSGGGAGAAGDVQVTAEDDILTKGQNSIGIFAQSVGGGGGAGGSSGSLNLSGSQSVNLATTMGGFGGNGTVGGYVEVDNSGDIWTWGEGAHGVLAQSIGGGGGKGGVSGLDEDEWSQYQLGGAGSVSFGNRSQNIAIAMGGSGGSGNDGGEVFVTNSGSIRTDGELAHVIYAQSVGGGGGDGGVATSVSGAWGAGKNGVYSIAMGGFGGIAGDGGLVTVENTGLLRSFADGSHAVFAQSVGGGGGAGGDARGFALAFSPSKSKGAMEVSVSLGGYGGAAGDGGEVNVENEGVIFTDGGQSYGILAQSIGGGGGAGGVVSTEGEEIPNILALINKGDAKGGQIAIGGTGAAAGDGGYVEVDNSGLVHTTGTGSHAIFAQSVGGGGGLGGSGLAGQISIGGQGAAAGDGGEVWVRNTGHLRTEGSLAKGVFAQSVGGGGGVGGATDFEDKVEEDRDAMSATMSTVGNLTSTAEFAVSLGQPEFGVGIGGMGGAAGDGGKVTVINSGGIETSGVLSTGIFAQSIGGGGGQGGEGIMAAVGQVVFSGLGGAAGDGGEVIVTNSGDITTQGFGAMGIIAQSVGGGGGMAGDYSLGLASWGNTSTYGGENYRDILDLQLNPFHANGGDGGDVTVTNTGAITINGIGAVGIFAQSVGGGGGLFGGKMLLGFIGSMEGVGEGGKVTVIQNGNVTITGKNGIAALFQSASKDGNDDITATINGWLKGGDVYGKGLLVDGGVNNTFMLNGMVEAVSNAAIVATIGNDTVTTTAGIKGNIDLGTGVNAYTNANGSTFETLDFVLLNGGDFTNAGLVTPGNSDHVQVTQVGGDFIQTATGVFDTDLDLLRTGLSGEIDQLVLTGQADVQGEFVLNIMNPGYALPGEHVIPILDGTGTADATGAILDAPVSAVATFELEADSGDVNLNYDIDFSPGGLNPNQTSLGDHINDIQLAGSSPTFAPIAAELFFVPTLGELANLYDSFTPETYAAQAAAITFAGQQFADGMMSCPTAMAAAQFSEDGCIWVKAGARWLELEDDGVNLAYDEEATGLTGGFEAALGGGLRIGGALSAEDVNAGVKHRTDAEGDRYQAGVNVKYLSGPVALAVAVHGGQVGMETRRVVLLPSTTQIAEAHQNMAFMGVTARASYRFGSEAGYFKPILEASRIKVETDAFTETGAGALNLVVPEQEDEFTRLSARIEVGGEFMAGNAAVRPFIRAGVSHLTDAEDALFAAAFAGAPAAATGGFNVNPGLDDTTYDAEVGVAVVGELGSGRLTWSGQFGDRTDNQTLSLKFTRKF